MMIVTIADPRNSTTSSGVAIPSAAPMPRAGSPSFSCRVRRASGSDHVDLFDGVLTSLVPHAELAERADLAERLSMLANAPRGLVGQLARDDEIAIAGPLLRRSPVIDEKMLIEIARMKGQGHLLAMSERPTLSTDLTDVIVAPRRPRRRQARRRQCGRSLLAERLFDADQARRPGWRADDHGRPARRSVAGAIEGPARRLDRRRPPPPVRGRQARTAGRHQAGDERHHRPDRTRGAVATSCRRSAPC